MKSRAGKFICTLLAVCMLLAVMPVSALAALPSEWQEVTFTMDDESGGYWFEFPMEKKGLYAYYVDPLEYDHYDDGSIMHRCNYDYNIMWNPDDTPKNWTNMIYQHFSEIQAGFIDHIMRFGYVGYQELELNKSIKIVMPERDCLRQSGRDKIRQTGAFTFTPPTTGWYTFTMPEAAGESFWVSRANDA